MAADLIESLPEEGDENRAALESVARNVCGVTYLGKHRSFSCCNTLSLTPTIDP